MYTLVIWSFPRRRSLYTPLLVVSTFYVETLSPFTVTGAPLVGRVKHTREVTRPDGRGEIPSGGVSEGLDDPPADPYISSLSTHTLAEVPPCDDR